ncbi:hypothetical protein LTR15_001345 [Elasticomyces elasticus]|nr:hypothetical protein LTR15_001345 [Elasticomyces elasticus]
MGAWGYGLFESDNDLDIVGDLSHEAGLEEVAKKLLAEKPPSQTDEKTGEKTDEKTDPEYYLSIHADQNPDDAANAAVRDHLNAGKLQELVDKYLAKYFANSDEDYHPPEYILCILGACAMSLGCTLPTLYKAQLKALYPSTLRMSEANNQMKKALCGPNGFVNGVPYDVESVGLLEMANRDDGGGAPGTVQGMNVQGQSGLFGAPRAKPDVKAKLRRTMEAIREEVGGTQSGVCGHCGAGGGKTLMKCGGCKKRQYCSKEHQKAHWKVHKDFCKAAEVVGGEETG